MKITKTIYLHTFTFLTVFLALARSVMDNVEVGEAVSENTADSIVVAEQDSAVHPDTSVPSALISQIPVSELQTDDSFVPHRILSVRSYKEEFPDSNEVQLVVAKKYGVKPVLNRKDAEKRKSELVCVSFNPYFHIDRLRESIPYLVPRATELLQDIGKAYYDSLYVKGVPLHQIIVTSVLRSEEDVVKLRRHNGNASENSCHRFGTTFDICYNRYVTVQTDAQPRRQVRNDSLKWVLSEVLRDFRNAGRCYVKYEVKQGCFHITSR